MAQRTVNPMRVVLAGLLFFLFASSGMAQITGEVESVGFQSSYRPDCFTPLVVRIKAPAGTSGDYQIQIKQNDLDSDHATFVRNISITGGENAPDQRFLLYFLPQPTGGGLPDRTNGTLRDLQKELKVFLCNKAGKQIATLPITSTLNSIDPPRSSFGNHRGMKLILAVVGNGSTAPDEEYQDQQALLGVMEDIAFQRVAVRDLPENSVAYDSVDAVLWMNVDPAELKAGGDEKYRALEMFVRQGGHLVICQSPQWQQYLEFGDLLPVTLTGMELKKDCYPLRELAGSKGGVERRYDPKNPRNFIDVKDPWEYLPGPFSIARAQAKPNALIDKWVQWDAKGEDQTPYIVRQLYGLGAITWVAQDLGDPALSRVVRQTEDPTIPGRTTGWTHVWDRVFDWKNTPVVLDKYTRQRDRDEWSRGGVVDMGKSLISGVELGSTVSALVAIAVAFFIVYWVIAGPGLFAYLVNKRRQNLSWFAFSVSAMVATLVTVLIVKLVVRGPPKLEHSSIIAQATGQPAIVRSSFGLYIKRDGDQRLVLPANAPGSVATLTALPMHPDFLNRDTDTASPIFYDVPVRGLGTDEPASLIVPYRSTMKKFLTTWSQPLPGDKTIEGSAKMDQDKNIGGTLTNATGKTLDDIYIAYKVSGEGLATDTDWLLWLKSWDPGVSLDLNRVFNRNDKGDAPAPITREYGTVPNSGKSDRIKSTLANWEEELWIQTLREKASVTGDGAVENLSQSFVLLSFFDRLHPIKNDPETVNRVEVLRRGGRHLDKSAALAAGALVILAHSKGELPVPLEVEGDKVTGPGDIYYQRVIPIDRGAANPPATQPSAEAK
jgi:hypothetical protein